MINKSLLKRIQNKSFENWHQSLLIIKHHWHDACASFWSSETNDEHHQCDVSEWAKDEYHYLAEKFNQDEEYTWEIKQAASTLWA